MTRPAADARTDDTADPGVRRSAQPREPVAAGRPRWWERPWIAPLMVGCVAFLAFSLPPYLTLDESDSRIGIRENVDIHYPMIVLHIAFGTVALVTSCFQVWPWFRRRHPGAHRRMGRAYVFAGVVPGSLTGFVVSALHTQGLVAQTGNFLLAVLWLITAVAGYRAARARRFREHRAWMIRGFALTTSIVVNRLWILPTWALAEPQLDSTFEGSELAMEQSMIGAAVWLSWVVNLLIAEWWIQYRGRGGKRRGRAGAGRTATAVTAPTATIPANDSAPLTTAGSTARSGSTTRTRTGHQATDRQTRGGRAQ